MQITVQPSKELTVARLAASNPLITLTDLSNIFGCSTAYVSMSLSKFPELKAKRAQKRAEHIEKLKTKMHPFSCAGAKASRAAQAQIEAAQPLAEVVEALLSE